MGAPLPKRTSASRSVISVLLFCLVPITIVAVWLDPFGLGKLLWGKPAIRQVTADQEQNEVRLVPGRDNTVTAPDEVLRGLGARQPDGRFSVVVVRPPEHGRPLRMPASTDLDPTRVARVRARFNAEVVEVGQVEDYTFAEQGGSHRELRAGDKVHKGDLLAVVWSTDVGARKSDLVDALVQLALDEQRLKARLELAKEGSVPRDTLEQTRRDVASDRNAVDRAERTLRTWNIPEQEIEVVRKEATEILRREGKRDREKERLWARSAILAPRDGTVVERNVSVGEFIADNTANLFVIADIRRLLVRASPPEDDLPTLLALPADKRRWTVETTGTSPVAGVITEIGYILDPSQHTGVVKGYIDNPQELLRAGQFANATVVLPAPSGVVEVPLSAIVDDHVFVQPDASKAEFTLRRVVVAQRFNESVYVRSELSPDERKLSATDKEKGLMPPEPLSPGEHVLTSGVLELKARLEELKFKAR